VGAVKLETFLDLLTDMVNRIITTRSEEIAGNRELWATDGGLRADGTALLIWISVWPTAAKLGGSLAKVTEMERLVRFEIADGVIGDAARMPAGVIDDRDALLAHMLGLWVYFRVPFLRSKITAILEDKCTS
jgi:hypothetical protein